MPDPRHVTPRQRGSGSHHSHSSSASHPYSDEGDSSGTGVQVSPTSGIGSHEYADSLDESDDWVLEAYPDDLGPSDSASRPRTSHQYRPLANAHLGPLPGHRPAPRRHERANLHERADHRDAPPRLSRRPTGPIAPGTVDPANEYPGVPRGHPGPPHPRSHGHWREPPPPGYAPSFASAPAYHPYPVNEYPGNASQLIPFGGVGGYAYQPAPSHHPYPPVPTPGPGPGGFFPPGHAPGLMAPPRAHPYAGQEMVGYGAGQGYFQNPASGYGHGGMPPNVSAPVYYQLMQSPPVGTPPVAAAVSKDDDKFARLEKILLDQKKAAEDKVVADAKAAADAAALAIEKKKMAEEAKKVAEAAAAAAAAAAAPKKEEKKKPIKFKDAVGRKFSFPYHLCKTWKGMEELIRQAFAHIDVIGPHVAEGHYDLIGPDGEIILPQVWETMIEPDWPITMHMWPIPEPPRPPVGPHKGGRPDQIVLVRPGGGSNAFKAGRARPKSHAGPGPPPPPPAPAAPGGGASMHPGITIVREGSSSGKKKAGALPGYLAWAAGSSTKAKSAKKASQKPEIVTVAGSGGGSNGSKSVVGNLRGDASQHEVVCVVM